jgi:hypothetical protein
LDFEKLEHCENYETSKNCCLVSQSLQSISVGKITQFLSPDFNRPAYLTQAPQAADSGAVLIQSK